MPKDIIDLPLQGRMASVRAGFVDEAARTVEIIWTTGATVRRARIWDEMVDEELSLDGSAVRLDRLNGGAPFLNSHDAWSLNSVLGVVVDGSARIANGQGTATIRFSERADLPRHRERHHPQCLGRLLPRAPLIRPLPRQHPRPHLPCRTQTRSEPQPSVRPPIS